MKKWCSMLALCLALAGCKQNTLLQNLEQSQANEVVAVLHRHNIEADKEYHGKNGYSVDVSKTDFATSVDILKAYDLPSRKPMEIADMFPVDSLVASPRAEKARLYSAIEQRLEQSLGTLSGVVLARVHVSYDLDAGDSGRGVPPVHLSALIGYEGEVDPDALINDVKRFLKNSFDEVQYNNISVVLSRRGQLQYAAPMSLTKARTQSFVSVGIISGLVIFLITTAGMLWYWRNGNRNVAVQESAAGKKKVEDVDG